MKRREFFALLGGAIACPLEARAQQPRLPTIGYLGATASSASEEGPRLAVLVQRLKELGWIEGRTVGIEYRWAGGHSERFSDFAAEFARLKADLIVTYSTPAVIAVKQITSAIPIVFAGVADPVGTGLVDSTNAVLEMVEVQKAARTLNLDIVPLEIRRAEEIAPAFDRVKGRTEALYVSLDPLTSVHRVRINILALGARMATLVPFRSFVQAGGLMCYGPSQSDVWGRTADYVDKILRGTKPADLPVEQPTKLDLIINLTTAKVLGLDVPSTLLARTDEVIE